MTINIDGFKIDYEIRNSALLHDKKPMIVFLHEGLGSRHQWKEFPDRINAKEKFPMLFFSRVGYGKSDYWQNGIPENFLRYDAFTTLPQLIKKLGIKNHIILFGHSDGATISLLAASIPLSNLLGVIIEAPHVFIEEKSIEGVFSTQSLLNNPDLLEKMNQYQNGRAEQLIKAWATFWSDSKNRFWEMKEELKSIICPILLIQGENDNFGTYKQLDTIEKFVKSNIINQIRLKDCGHTPHREKIDEVVNACEKFIQTIRID